MIDSKSLHFVRTDNYRELLVRSYLNMVLSEIFIETWSNLQCTGPKLIKN